MNWQPEAYKYLINEQYSELVSYYENKLEVESEQVSDYSYLGLAYLLQGKEEEAQTAWFFVLTQEKEQYFYELISILDQEAQRAELEKKYQTAYLIRSHLREIDGELINNVLKLINLEIELNIFQADNWEKYQLEELLSNEDSKLINLRLFWEVLPKIMFLKPKKTLTIIKMGLNYIDDIEDCINKLDNVARFFEDIKPELSVEITKQCLLLKPDDLYLMKNLGWRYFRNKSYQQALEIISSLYEKTDQISRKVFFNNQLLEILLAGNFWLDVNPTFQRHKVLLSQAVEKQECPRFIKDVVVGVTRPLLYLEDKPKQNRLLQNKIAKLFEKETRINYSNPKWSLYQKEKSRKLRIGYVSHTLRKHSVGWLSRWLFKYHNREKFEIFVYLIEQVEDEITQEWIKKNSDVFYNLSAQPDKIAEKIWSDKVAILIDLDSTTHHTTCQIMSLKPAPIQITWLGLDSAGIPSVDYFIVDSYVLPEDAQDYYQESLWRLPHTYLSIDGFEVDVPTLTRKDLDIPENAVIYFNTQNSLKRHPDMIHLQMKIIKQVENSYFLIKGNGDQDVLKQLFTTIAKEEGVNINRLRFLEKAPTEAIHRANLKVADIVLDTYPYNGATTTLETLWMEIPLVTRVGEQFAARNSYTFMINAGISEGIAWTDEEYIEWGVKLGQDENLRQKMVWKLRESKKTSPLWKAKQFTKEMERAYQQMWEKYVASNE